MAKSINSDPRAQVNACRSRIAELKAERESLDDALLPQDVATKRAEQYVADLIADAGISCRSFAERNAAPTIYAGFSPQTSARTTVGLLAWLAPDLLAGRIEAQVAEIYADAPLALSAADVSKRRNDINAELFELELQDELGIQAAADHGVEINRRIDADPRAIVGSLSVGRDPAGGGRLR